MVEQTTEGRELFAQLHQLLDGGDERALYAFFADLHAADVADCLEQVEPEERSRVMFLLPPRKWAEAVALLEESVRSDVLEELTDDQVGAVLGQLPADDVVDVLDEMDDDVARKVVGQLSPELKAVVEPLRQYDEDTAGGLMNPEFVSVHADGTVADAIEEIRRLTPRERDDVFYIYCLDRDGHLIGVVPAMRLLTAKPDRPVRQLLASDMIVVHAVEDQEEVKNKFEKYDLAALPVLDDDGRMLGVITHDDVLEVAEEEAEEDIFHMAGTDAMEFAKSGIFHAASIRARWLLPCLAGTFIGVLIILYFKAHLPEQEFAVVLAFLTPIAAMGGNAGVQTSTVVVRGLATNDILTRRLKTAVAREFRIILVVALVAGLIAGGFTFLVIHSGIIKHPDGGPLTVADLPLDKIAISVGCSMTIAIIVSGLLAMTLPYAFRRFGIDPAIATGPLITTANDSISAATYLLIAVKLIGGAGLSG